MNNIMAGLATIIQAGETLYLDNDVVFAYAGEDDDAECIFRCEPSELLEALLNEFGVSWSYV